MDENLGVPVDPLVKLLICGSCVVDVYLMGHHKARFGSARNDQVTQIPVVCLDVALTSLE